MILLIDGYNVIYRWREKLWIRGGTLREEREKLVSLSGDYLRRKKGIEKVVVFFDGREGIEFGPMSHRPQIEIHFSRGETADEAILGWIRAGRSLGRKNSATVLATDDLELSRKARDLGVEVLSVEELWKRCQGGAKSPRVSGKQRPSDPGKKPMSWQAQNLIDQELRKRWRIPGC